MLNYIETLSVKVYFQTGKKENIFKHSIIVVLYRNFTNFAKVDIPEINQNTATVF